MNEATARRIFLRPPQVEPLHSFSFSSLVIDFFTMKDYPPSQTPGSFNLEKVQKQIEAAPDGE
jgi:hypothetical protein